MRAPTGTSFRLLLLVGAIGCPAAAPAVCTDYSAEFLWEATEPHPDGSPGQLVGDTLVSFHRAGGQWFMDATDLSDPGDPEPAFRGALPADSTRAVEAESVRLLHASGVVSVVDLADPLDPAIVGTFASPGHLDHVLAGRYAYITAYFRGYRLRTVDLGDPRAPVVVGEQSLPSYSARIVETDGVLALLCGYPGNQIALFDLEDPSAPRQRGSITMAESYTSALAAWSRNVYWSHTTFGMVILDVQDPDYPRVRSFVPTESHFLWQQGGFLFHGDALLRVADIGNPAEFRPLAVVPHASSYIRYVGFASEWLVELAGPAVFTASPWRVLGGFSAPVAALQLPGARDIAVAGNLAFTAGPGRTILDVSIPTSPRVVGDFSIAANPEDVCVDGGQVYFSLGAEGLMIADTEGLDLPNPDRRSWIHVGAFAQRVDAEAGLAVLSTDTTEILLVDVADPEAPHVLNRHALPWICNELDLEDGVLRVATDTGIHLVDVRDPLAPVVRGTLALPGRVRSVRARGDLSWVAGDFGLASVTTQDLDEPRLQRLWEAGPANDVVPAGRYAYVARAAGIPPISVLDTQGPDPPFGASYGDFRTVHRIVPYGDVVVALTEDSIVFVASQCQPTALVASGLSAVVNGRSILVSWEAAASDGWTVHREAATAPGYVPLPLTPGHDGGRWSCADADVAADVVYRYRVAPIRTPDLLSEPVEVRTPAWPSGRIALSAPSPNPLRGRSEIGFTTFAAGPARLAVHDVGGRLVRVLVRAPLAAGEHRVAWDGRDANGHMVGSGTYFVVLRSAGDEATTRLIVLR